MFRALIKHITGAVRFAACFYNPILHKMDKLKCLISSNNLAGTEVSGQPPPPTPILLSDVTHAKRDPSDVTVL